MNFNITYSADTLSAPAGFRTAFDSVAQYLAGHFTDNITINVTVGWGEVNGDALDAGAIGSSESFLFTPISYTAVRNALIADAKSADDMTAISNLPVSDPTGGGSFAITTALAKAAGAIAGNDPDTDGFVGFSSSVPFDFDPSNGISPGTYDFFGAAAHELTEIMGRQTLNGANVFGNPSGHDYEPLDLFHYFTNGVRTFSPTLAGYFSINGGATHLANFNTDPTGDAFDWAGSVGNDSFRAFSSSGVVNPVSAVDLIVMDILGYNLNHSPVLTSNGGGINGFASTAENSSAVTTVTATDSDAGTTLSYAISGGADAARFQINSSSGALSFISAPDYENPTDADHNNTYLVNVSASDGLLATAQSLVVTVTNVSPVINGDGADNTLNGTSEEDTISGFGGNDTINGFAGDDFLVGDQGLNTIDGGAGQDTADYFWTAGGVRVDLGAASNQAVSLVGGGEGFTDQITNVERVRGGLGNDTDVIRTVSPSVVQQFDGNAGVDTVDFSPFASAVWVDLTYAGVDAWTKDTANLTTGNWRAILDLIRVENVVTSAFDDFVKTGFDNNVVSIIGGHDTIDTGAGNDTIDFSQFASAVWVDFSYADDQAWTRNGADVLSGTWVKLASITNAEVITGSAFADQIYVNAGMTSVAAGGGNDTIFVRAVSPGVVANLDGGGGNDTVDFAPFGSAVWVDLTYAGPEAWTKDTANLTSGNWRAIGDLNSVENIAGTPFDDFIKGDGGANIITYTGGADQLDGAGGTDTLDLTRYGSALWVDLSLTTQNLWTKDGPTLTAGNWRLLGDVANFENVIGTAGGDYFIGASGNNVIDGKGGVDTMSYVNASAGVSVDLAAGGAQATGGAGTDTLISIENLTGSGSGDALYGDSGANVLDGGAGADTLAGRGGDDIYVVDNAGDVVTENASEGTDLVRTALAAYTLAGNVENFQFTGAGSYAATGNASDNSFLVTAITNGALATLNGAGGSDTADFSQFGGAVWAVLDYPGIEAWTTDAADQSHGTYRTIADLNGIENLVGTAFNDDLRGDAGANTIFYTGGFDAIDGASGNDTADFSRFASAVWVDLTYAGPEAWTKDAPTLNTGLWRAIADLANIENINGTAGADYLRGDGGANRIGNGGGGDDLMTGGAGADAFVFAPGASGAFSGFAVITDFQRGSDHIELPSAFAAALHITFSGADSVADLGAAGTFHITTTGIANLDMSDFLFV